MSLKIEAILSQNITLVYKAIDLQAIDTRQLKTLSPGQESPAIMDIPNAITIIYPSMPVIVQFDERRLRMVLPNRETENNTVFPCDLLVKSHKLVPGSQEQLVAYGFNYDVLLSASGENLEHKLIDLLIANPERIEIVLEGELVAHFPRYIFEHNKARYDLRFDTAEEQGKIRAIINVHFQADDIVVPPEVELQEAYHNEFRYLSERLPALFEGASK